MKLENRKSITGCHDVATYRQAAKMGATKLLKWVS